MSQLQNYFQLFKLPEEYAVDQSVLTDRYRSLQKVLHPDNFASAADKEKRLSVQQSAWVNDAYRVLRSPVERAKYLLQLKGVDVDDGNNNIMDPMFLMQQMELRESLASVSSADDPVSKLDTLMDSLAKVTRDLEVNLLEAFGSGSLDQAVQLVHKMQFYLKLQQEADAIEARLE